MLLFINKDGASGGIHVSISIHLMLLFIASIIGVCFTAIRFQYISCYCLSVFPVLFHQFYQDISIHLMLLFIYRRKGKRTYNMQISIHLMLLFIAENAIRNSSKYDFNTSHVTVYHQNLMILELKQKYFNTSHVTVYRYQSPVGTYQYIFQYISCYCLSSLEILLNGFKPHFNTSHVTVYPK